MIAGLVGVGRMGSSLARRLVDCGWSVIAHDVSIGTGQDVADAGVTNAPSAKAVAVAAPVVILCLPDSDAVMRAAGGSEGVLAGCVPGSAIIDMSSADPSQTVELSLQAAALGVDVLDAPMSGGMQGAADGELVLLVGGETAVLERHRALLDALGVVEHVGSAGCGHLAKALSNYVSAVDLITGIEALRVARANGMDEMRFVRALDRTVGRNHASQVKLPKYIIPQRYDSGFTIALMAKDLRHALKLARAAGVVTPFLEQVAEGFTEADRQTDVGADLMAIDRFDNLGELFGSGE